MITKTHDLETLPMLLKSNLLEYKLLRYENSPSELAIMVHCQFQKWHDRMNRVSSNMARMQHKIFFYQVRSIGIRQQHIKVSSICNCHCSWLTSVGNSARLRLFVSFPNLSNHWWNLLVAYQTPQLVLKSQTSPQVLAKFVSAIMIRFPNRGFSLW